MNNSLISVIVPVYNVEQYIHECVDSILNQTYTNLEIILVDDGSPDNCGKICDEYSETDARIKVIHKTNGGLSDARNVALDIARGDYITFVDSDDYISRTYIEGLYNLLIQNNVDIAINSYCAFEEGTSPVISNTNETTVILSGINAVEEMYYQKLFDTMAWSKLYKKELLKNIRYPQNLLFEDLATTYRLFLQASKIVFQNRESYFYRLRNNSIEGSAFNEKKAVSALAVVNEMSQDEDKLFPVINSYRCRITSFLFHIYLQMPKDCQYRKEFEKRIKRYRWGVICNRKARKKTRIACLISLFGFKFVELLFKSKFTPKLR